MGEIQLPHHWKIVKLGDMVRESIRDGVHQTPTYVNYGIPFIKGKDIFDNKVSFANCSYISLEEHLKISKRVKPELEDILLTKVGTVGNVAIIETSDNFSIFVQVALIKPKLNEVDSRFLMYVLHSRCGQEEIASKSSQSTMRFIGTQKIATIKIPLPTLPEQKTIAHTLRTIQKAKETRQRELELERERKAALMQYLFTHGTRNEPRKQTKIGEVPKSWDVVSVGKICKCIVPGRNKPKRFDGDIPWITIPDIREKITVNSSLSGLAVSKEVVLEAKSRIIPAGSVIMSCVGNFGITTIAECDIVINQQLHAFICPEYLEPYFLSHALQRQKAYMEGIALVTVMAYINKEKCNSVPIPLASFEEQQEITTILKACDRKIQALEKEIALMDELFRAMLEQLMTGKISTQPLTETYV